MKSWTTLPAKALLAVLVAAAAEPVYGQRLYDEGRDKQAQAAVKLAEEIISKSSFENQLKNLDAFSRRDSELYFRNARRQMELDIATFRTWGQVNSYVGERKKALSADTFITNAQAGAITDDLEIDCSTGERTTELGKSICTAQGKLADLKKAVKKSEDEGKALEQELKSRLEKIDTVEALSEKVNSFLKADTSNNKTIKGLSEVFTNMATSYVNYTNKLAVINNQTQDDLRLLLQRIAVEALQVEAEHWKTVGEILLRRNEEQKDLRFLVGDFDTRYEKVRLCLALTPDEFANERIDKSFARAKALQAGAQACANNDPDIPKDEIVAYLYQTMHDAAALAARGETPMKLAQMRLAHEEHRYSIRQSAVIAKGYELTFTSGTKRLGRYYAGGIKPEKVAQLIYTAATVAIPAVIAGK